MKISVIHEEIELVLEGTYQPEERRTLEHPGFSESYDIDAVYIDGCQTDINPLLAPKMRHTLSKMALERIGEREF